jgi:acetyl esterase/lipase
MQTLRLNLYQPPASDVRKLRPAAVCMTGGAFRTGDRNRNTINNWAKHFASRGFVAITIDYRLGSSPGAKENRDAAYDAKAAIRWLVKHSARYRISTDHIVTFGASAGGMIVAWLTAMRGDGDGNTTTSVIYGDWNPELT